MIPMLHPAFQKELPKVIELFKKHKIKSAYAFGSVVTDRFNPASDVDLIVNLEEGLDPVIAGGHLWDLQDELRDLFNREIDLITERSLKNPYFIKELNETRLPIYG